MSIKQKYIMQRQYKNDDNISMHITLNKPFYFAGETITGKAYLKSKQQSSYNQLYLRIHGKEQVQWKQQQIGQSKKYRQHSRSSDTYYDQFYLDNFDGNLDQCTIIYPFNINLPNAFPSSFMINSANYIQYKLTLDLTSLNSSNDPQTYIKKLQIRQPVRIQKGSSINREIRQQICCCNCCCQENWFYGNVLIKLETCQNSIEAGQKIEVKGLIDTTNSLINLNGYEISLVKVEKRVAVGNSTKTSKQYKATLYRSTETIYKGQKLSLKKQIQIPTSLKSSEYTSIGSIIYRAYFISLKILSGCFFKNSSSQCHVILTSNIASQQLQTQPPQSQSSFDIGPCSSVMKRTTLFLNPKIYIYKPCNSIDLINQVGIVGSFPSQKSLFPSLSHFGDDRGGSGNPGSQHRLQQDEKLKFRRVQ